MGIETQKWSSAIPAAIVSSIVSVLITSFVWMMVTVDLRADIAVLKSNMQDVRASVRAIEQRLGEK